MDTTDLELFNNLIAEHLLLFIIIIAWSLVWKGLALWRAGTLRQKHWFIALLIVNSLGILDIIYLYFVARKYEDIAEGDVPQDAVVEVIEKNG